MPLTADSSTTALAAAIDALQQQARDAGQRALVVAAGSSAWGQALAAPLWQHCSPKARLWLSARPAADQPQQIPLSRAVQMLGQEYQLLIVDAHAGFSADAFGAISGTLIGGGVLLMLVPPLDDWATQPAANHAFGAPPSGFIRHLCACIEADPALLLLQAPDRIRTVRQIWQTPLPRQATPPCRSDDQQRAVETLIELGEAATPRPLVITSDRGRGKSAALGIAAAELLRRHSGYRIGVCAPRPQASAALFERASALLPDAIRARNRLDYHAGRLAFFAVDALLAEGPTLDLLLIDEAASVPLPLLQQLLTHYPRIAFASTVHGYEGTGRGFALRFAQMLDQQTPGWQALQLAQPIRWQDGDPLERFVFNALLLDAEPPAVDTRAITPADCRFIEHARSTLPDAPARLRQLFGLLVLAHYRTRPEDLQRLLDAPDLRLFSLDCAGQPVAVAVLGNEGGFTTEIAGAIYHGRRRPQGHLLAQSLAFHAGVPDAAEARYARILRIGVHPDLQRRGLGSTLLQRLIQTLEAEGNLDAIGASFSAGAELLPFWQRAGLQPVRIGLTREHTSGRHSLLVLKPLNHTGQRIYAGARQRLEQHWAALRAGPLQDLEPALVAQLQPHMPTQPDSTLDAADRQDLDSFTHGLRGYEVCAWPIEKLITQLFANEPDCAARLEPNDRQLLIRRVIDKCDWPTLCHEFKLDGQKAARRRLREAVRRAWQQWEKR